MTTIHRWRAFSVLAVAYFMTIVDLTIVNVSLPSIGRDLRFSESGLQWVVTAYGVTFGGLLLLGGRAADALGRRRVFLLGLVVFTAASLACALARDDTFLVVMRGVQGAGAAIVLPAALSIVMNMFTEGAERNKALGLWGAIGASGATIGLITGGLVTRYLGWEYIFYLNIPTGLAALMLAPRVVPESRIETLRRRFDSLGALTVTAGLLLLVYGISTAPQDGWGAAKSVGSLTAGGALLIAFLVIEARAQSPLLPLRILRMRTVAGADSAGFLLGGSFYAFVFVGTLYMQQVLGYSALQTGLAWLATSLTSVALAGLSQLLVGRVGSAPILAAGMAMISGGTLWAAHIGVHGRFWADLAGPLFVTGAGTAFAFIPISIAGLTGVSARDAGLASGLLNTAQQLGGAIGVAVTSTVAASRAGALAAAGRAPDVALTGGFRDAFYVCAALAALGVLIGGLIIPRRTTALTQRLEPAVAASAADKVEYPDAIVN
ncbi:DHA2 family efflux MFS transporter permease subunit [Actinocrinis puniceicyclus]|uniref:DHA2 family efflux MFS transporter permease subunit n=1 Tax=Actinocrinis puniceicyclus TaxID=977794 RepID=A0A8J8BD68_9ACTN|nr:DHA2 family efflux MFS transporter permease subunit [Actinocrinis puniceicyclus]MBS2964285.1 DHA2 family efflux MFS transporter permease subunit [Actinocrinis puniceicyclus]